MTLSDRAIAARLVLVERRDTPAVRDPAAARVRRYRLARTQLAPRETREPRDVPARETRDVAARDTRDVPARFRPRET